MNRLFVLAGLFALNAACTFTKSPRGDYDVTAWRVDGNEITDAGSLIIYVTSDGSNSTHHHVLHLTHSYDPIHQVFLPRVASPTEQGVSSWNDETEQIGMVVDGFSCTFDVNFKQRKEEGLVFFEAGTCQAPADLPGAPGVMELDLELAY